MNFNLKHFITLDILIFILLINLLIASNIESKLNPDYQLHYKEHKTSYFQFKLISCLSLISTSLKKKDGNIYLHQAIKKTKLDRDKFYDKYTIALITQCINNINDGQMDYLLIPENVDNYDISNKTLLNLIKLDYEITTLELTYEENEIKKAIDEIVTKKDKGKKDSGILFFNLNSVIKFICCAIPFVLFLLYNTKRMMDNDHKKEMDEGTKELIEMIKARGKNSPNYKEPKNEEENKDKGQKPKDKVKKE
jgi:hypothetical protein